MIETNILSEDMVLKRMKAYGFIFVAFLKPLSTHLPSFYLSQKSF